MAVVVVVVTVLLVVAMRSDKCSVDGWDDMTKQQRLEAEVFLCVKSWVMKTYNGCGSRVYFSGESSESVKVVVYVVCTGNEKGIVGGGRKKRGKWQKAIELKLLFFLDRKSVV
mgnify:FL=1